MTQAVEIAIPTPGGERIAATHHRADDDALALTAGRPCIVMAHGVGATRDCGLSAFAESFATAGADVVAFDYRHFGESSGLPRQLVSIRSQLADYHTVIGHARGLPGIDPRRIIVWGVSLSGGHVIKVAARDPAIAAVVSLTPAVDGLAAVAQMAKTNELVYIARLLGQGLSDVSAALRRRPPVLAPIVGSPGQIAALNASGSFENMLAIAGPSWQNAMAARIFLSIGTYRPGRLGAKITCPVLMQIADHDQSAPAGAATRTATTTKATVHHYPCDHFDVYAGASFHEHVLADQIAFLRRICSPADHKVSQ